MSDQYLRTQPEPVGSAPASAHTRPNGEPGLSTESLGELVREVATDATTLVRQELELAKAELKQDAKEAGKAAGLLGAAGVAGWLVVLFVSLTVMWALGEVMDLAWAALIVAVIWAATGAVLYVLGRRQLARVEPGPEQTVESLKEDVRWAKRRTR